MPLESPPFKTRPPSHWRSGNVAVRDGDDLVHDALETSLAACQCADHHKRTGPGDLCRRRERAWTEASQGTGRPEGGNRPHLLVGSSSGVDGRGGSCGVPSFGPWTRAAGL